MMREMRLIGLCAVLGLAGCFSLAREETPQQHYVLGGGVPQRSEARSRDPAALTIGLRRLQLAEYLESSFIVVRQGPTQIRFAEFHRWGELLGGGINRAVAGYLAAEAPFPVVDAAPWPLRDRYDYLVQLHVLRFEGVAPVAPDAVDGEVHLLATWEIIRQKDGEVLARGTTDYRKNGWRVGDYSGLVTQLDAGLHALSKELMATVATLGSPGPS